ncbi:arrestin domain-containing protein 3 isoform X2 [Oryzias melastigma]|uniref:arrestin domain-containing protein 3 isoform X2 n=1 Tax=Oryzias melastigma TaxID=30732 RepID=UPI000CF80F6D|nr:arrestin domain-containing protein 3 isoform X2 [Oryzias melastigma]
MNSTVKKLDVTYNPINERNTFTNGDFIIGQVTLEMETHGETTVVYHSKEKYFTLKQYFIRNQNVKEPKHVQLINHTSESYPRVVAPGIHVYPFCFQIPLQGIPSAFKGDDGKIVFSLEAELSRSMRIDKNSTVTINFEAKPDPNILSRIMTPLRDSKDKKMNVFTSGSVAMDVRLEKSGFYQGEGIKVVSFIQNNSSREIKPKYCIYRKHSFFANGERRVHTKDLIKEVGAPIPKKTSETVKQVITVPHDALPSILNCNIIKAEYRLRVYLDVKFASNPTIKFDIIVLPVSLGSAHAPPPYSAAGFEPEAFGKSAPTPWNSAPAPWDPAAPKGKPAPPACNPVPPQPSSESPPFGAPPPPYETHQLYPSPNDFSQTKL